jgi:hypothetical protein
MIKVTGQPLRRVGNTRPPRGATIDDTSDQRNGPSGDDAMFHPSTQWG